MGFLAVGYHLSYTYDNQGCNHGWKVEGTKVSVPTPGCLRPAPVRPLWGSGDITPRKFVKTQMLNPAFWWLLAVKFLAFWKLRPRSWGDQYIVGPPTFSPSSYGCCAYDHNCLHQTSLKPVSILEIRYGLEIRCFKLSDTTLTSATRRRYCPASSVLWPAVKRGWGCCCWCSSHSCCNYRWWRQEVSTGSYDLRRVRYETRPVICCKCPRYEESAIPELMWKSWGYRWYQTSDGSSSSSSIITQKRQRINEKIKHEIKHKYNP